MKSRPRDGLVAKGILLHGNQPLPASHNTMDINLNCFCSVYHNKKYMVKQRYACNLMPHLVAINFHDRGPSSISTSKISHVTENRDWF